MTGFLGAGKSTLVSYVLTAQHGRRIAVVVNEFGAGLGLERALVRDGDASDRYEALLSGGSRATRAVSSRALAARRSAALVEELIELPNGCICCTVKDTCVPRACVALRASRDKERSAADVAPRRRSFLQTLEALLEKRDKFDHILVETTGAARDSVTLTRSLAPLRVVVIRTWADGRGAGLADPGPVAQALWADDALEPGAALDAIVTVVDAAHFRAQLAEPQAAEAMQQVAYADVVLLNKTDLVVSGAATCHDLGSAPALLRLLTSRRACRASAIWQMWRRRCATSTPRRA